MGLRVGRATVTRFEAASSAEVAAPAVACFELVCDTVRTPEWQRAVAATSILERDAKGRTSLVRTSIDAIVTQIVVDLRLSYDAPRSVHMQRESGDLRDLTVIWTFEDLIYQRARAAFSIAFDPGRMLSLLATGPVVPSSSPTSPPNPPKGLGEPSKPRTDGERACRAAARILTSMSARSDHRHAKS